MSEQIEATVDAVRVKLGDFLNAKIDAINASLTDDYTLDYPTEIVIGTRAEPAYPIVMVLPDTSATTVDTGLRVYFSHRVRVVSWLSDYVEDALARRLMRYQRAIRETLLEHGRQPGGLGDPAGYGMQHVEDEYGPVFAPDQVGYFVQSAQSIFAVQQQQTL
jgi:hypothetical protein